MERNKKQVAPPVQGITFDLEGTIIDLESLHHSAHLHAAAAVGMKLTWDEALRRLPHFIGGPDEQVAVEIAALAGRNASASRILSAKNAYFNDLLEKREGDLVPRDGFIEFFYWARTTGIKLAIGTVNPRTLALSLLKHVSAMSDLGQEFIVAKEDVASLKPAPDVYLETAKRMGIKATDQLVFEDSLIGLKAAQSAGCNVVAMPTVKDADFIQNLYTAGAEAVFLSWKDSNLQPFVSRLIDGNCKI